MSRPVKAVYVHGRPAPHPNRLVLLPAIGAELVPVDHRLPWADRAAPPRWRKWLSLALCACTFPRRREWDVLIGDGPQHLPVLMKTAGLLRRDQRIVPYLAGEFSWFLATGYYGSRKTTALKRWFARWDAYLCLGPMIAELTRQVLPPERHSDVFEIQNFIRQERMDEMLSVAPDLEVPRILTVANGPAGFRVHYKGLDLMCDAFARASVELPGLEWSIVGEWSEDVQRACTASLGAARERVAWRGYQPRLAGIAADHGLYLHCARGDAWPNTVMEAMAAGLPAIVSEWTGVRELVARVDRRLVTPLDPQAIAEAIGWYWSLSPQGRRELGDRAREVVRTHCTQAQAIGVFQNRFRELLEHFGMGELAIPAAGTAAVAA